MRSFLFIFFLIASSSFAQTSKPIDIPNSLCIAYENNESKISHLLEKGKKKSSTSFKCKSKKTVEHYDEQGFLSRSEIQISHKKLPAEILTDIHKRYKEYNIFESIKIYDRDGGISYEVEVIKGSADYKLVYDSTGKLIKESDLFTLFLWQLFCAAI